MKLRSLPLVGLLLGCTTLALAADWPQWRGPDRSGVSKEKGLLKAWPKGGPKLLWTCRTAGIGFSGPAIVGDRLYTIGGRDEMTYVIAINVKDGKEIWSTKIGPIYTFKGNQWGDGPRSTPTVDGEHLYALDATGTLVCLATADGKEVWRKNLLKELNGKVMTDEATGNDWGYCESPLVDGDKLICTPGGAKGTLAALNKKTGAELWRSSKLTNQAPHSSAIISNADGIRQYVQESYIDQEKGGVVSGFDPKNGNVLWSASIFKGHSYSIACTPIIKDNLVYVTSDQACHLFEVTDKAMSTKELYPKRSFKTLKCNHGGAVLVGGHVYGHLYGLAWVCQDFKTGKAAWVDRTNLECQQSGSIVAAGGRLYLLSDKGTVVLLEANPKEWQESGRYDLPEKSKGNANRPTGGSAGLWTHPVVANGRLYLRDQELIFCYDVREKK